MSFRILGTGSAAPKFTLTNDQMAEIVETSDEWIRQRTGIGSRRICKDENLLDLSVRAAEEALASAGVRPEELDLIICTTLRGELITPNHACLVQEVIGASCPAFDINVACTGLIYALDIADCYFARGKVKKILIVSAEQMSSIVNWTDRSTCVLFGDGTGAVVLGEGDGLRAVTVHAEGNREVLYIPRGEGKLFDGDGCGRALLCEDGRRRGLQVRGERDDNRGAEGLRGGGNQPLRARLCGAAPGESADHQGGDVQAAPADGEGVCQHRELRQHLERQPLHRA